MQGFPHLHQHWALHHRVVQRLVKRGKAHWLAMVFGVEVKDFAMQRLIRRRCGQVGVAGQQPATRQAYPVEHPILELRLEHFQRRQRNIHLHLAIADPHPFGNRAYRRLQGAVVGQIGQHMGIIVCLPGTQQRHQRQWNQQPADNAQAQAEFMPLHATCACAGRSSST